jgi:hypothetical protein
MLSKFLIGVLTVFMFVGSHAQSSLTIDATQFYSSFKFQDSGGNSLNNEYSGVFTGAYGLGYQYTTDFGLIARGKIGMRNAGANLLYDDMNYSWKLQYADTRLGVGYLYTINKINPYFIASGYFGYLLRGIQVLNNEQFNITESGLLNKMDYGLVFSPGVEFNISDYISAYTEFNYLMGLANLEKDLGQKSTNFAMGITLGLSLKFVKKEK